jgi:methionyl-tRNA formyltransferase
MNKIKIIFWGTPDFALPALQALANNPQYQLLAVVTQPDKPCGRGRQLTAPPVKKLAENLGLPIYQPSKLKEETFLTELAALQPQVMVLAAYGKIIPSNILTLAPAGIINIHPSLLPRYRGSSPLSAPILAGDQETGVTIMQLDTEMDHGPLLAQSKIKIATDDTAASLEKKLSELGAALLLKTLPAYLEGKIIPQPQNHALATTCPFLQKEAGRLDWQKSVIELARRIRAFYPWPGTFATWPDKANQEILIKILPPIEAICQPTNLPPGKFLIIDNRLAITGQDGYLLINQLQPAGKNIMTDQAFIAGYRTKLNF